MAKKIIFDIENEEFKNNVLQWLEHKNTVGEPYTKIGTLRGCITRIRGIHEDDIVVSAKIKHAIQQGWQGFFPASDKEVRQIREFGVEGFLEMKKNGGGQFVQKGGNNERKSSGKKSGFY